MPPRSLPSQRRPSCWLAALLVLALLYAQALGQAHRALHPPGAAGGMQDAHGHAVAHMPDPGHVAAAEATAHAQDALFGHEPAADDCRLFDQLSLGEMASVAALGLAAAPPAITAGTSATAVSPGRPCRSYQPRGPPEAAA